MQSIILIQLCLHRGNWSYINLHAELSLHRWPVCVCVCVCVHTGSQPQNPPKRFSSLGSTTPPCQLSCREHQYTNICISTNRSRNTHMPPVKKAIKNIKPCGCPNSYPFVSLSCEKVNKFSSVELVGWSCSLQTDGCCCFHWKKVCFLLQRAAFMCFP